MVRFLAVTIIATAFPFVCAAGPMLDTLVSAMGNVRSITREQETMVGVSEVYTGVRIAYGSASAITNIKKATISRAGSNYVVFLEGVDATTKNGPVSMGSVEVQIDPAALSHNALFTDLMEGRPASPSDCARIKDDIFFAVRRLVSVDMQADAMDVKFGFEESRVECLLDFTVSMEGMVAKGGMKVGLMKVAGVGPLTMRLPEIRTGEEFSVTIDIRDADSPLDRVRYDEVGVSAYIDADSATGLARAGLNDLLWGGNFEFSTTDGNKRMDDLWDAALKLDCSVDVSIKGMTMAPEAQPHLKAGAKQDVRLFLQKSEQSIVFQSAYSTPELLDLDVSADIVMNKATRERGFEPMLGLLGIPISLSGVSANLSDRGAIGLLTAQFGNASVGDVLNLMMAERLSRQNVEAINTWIAGARDGGIASVKATPREPLRLDELSRIIQADPAQLLDIVDIEDGLSGQ